MRRDEGDPGWGDVVGGPRGITGPGVRVVTGHRRGVVWSVEALQQHFQGHNDWTLGRGEGGRSLEVMCLVEPYV